ncbi:hypothetical protein PTW35_24080 (plasmid) [Photobacterium sp. DA100]|uniref:hypothetical protein n=1 Tax=Photobacterium sp. DA100 TaxID=3027472 RepID=UPI00247A43AB|nr:hypothetical protein [Photobacterium sp. DA100]WEM44359.1 hypothetical protein PTW35_24080 [Photobacterium sp. DA100]
MKRAIQDVLAAAGMMSIVLFSSVGLAKDEGRTRLECGKSGAYDTSMSARYEVRDGREKFDVSFEAAPTGYFFSGQELDVHVDYVFVGKMMLRYVGFDLQGDLEFDTNIDGANDDSVPFPEDFPSVERGTHVTVGYLGCSL